MPMAIEGFGLIYNKKIFDACEIKGEQISTFSELKKAVKTINDKIIDGSLNKNFPNLTAVFEFPAKEKDWFGLYAADLALSKEFSSPIDAYKSNKLEFRYAQNLKNLIDLQVDYSESGKKRSKLNTVDYIHQLEKGMAIERIAIILQGDWIFQNIQLIDPNVATNLRIIPAPITDEGQEDSLPIGVPMYWAINKNSKDAEKKAAKKFLDWLYTCNGEKDIIEEKFSLTPPFSKYVNIQSLNPLAKTIKEYAEKGKIFSCTSPSMPQNWIEDVVGTDLQNYLTEKETWEKLISNAKTGWQKNKKDE
jgi:raffinose/stachyose/melibiose transport system substrate-binding protein